MKILILAFLPLLFAAEEDPNGFFKDRQWSVEAPQGKLIKADSKYLGEPIQRPNKVEAHLICGKNKKAEVFSKKYCGINYMKVVAGKLEVMFLDYNSSDPRGYCTIKRIERFNLPKCK